MRPRAWRRAPGRSRRWVSPLVRRPLRPRGGERLHIRSPPLLSGRSSVLLVGREGPGSCTRRCGCWQKADSSTLQKCRVADTHLVTRLLQAFHAHVACTAPPKASQARQGGGRRRTQSGVVARKEASPQHAPPTPQQRATTFFTAATPRLSAYSSQTHLPQSLETLLYWSRPDVVPVEDLPVAVTRCQGDSRHRDRDPRNVDASQQGSGNMRVVGAEPEEEERVSLSEQLAGHTCPADAPSTASSNASSATLRHASLIAAIRVTLAPAGGANVHTNSEARPVP